MTTEREYVVLENTPGYMPEEEEPFSTSDYSAAVDYLNERAEEYASDESGAYTVEYGLASADNLAAVRISDNRSAHDLGRVIQIIIAEPTEEDFTL